MPTLSHKGRQAFPILSVLKRDLSALKPEQKQKRNRLIVLSFVSVLLLLEYGPLAQWFVAADRVLYDQLATHLRTEPLDHAVIASVDPSKLSANEISDKYGQIIAVLSKSKVKRIIITEPPELPDRWYIRRAVRFNSQSHICSAGCSFHRRNIDFPADSHR